MVGHPVSPDSPAFPAGYTATGTSVMPAVNSSHVWQDYACLQFCSGDGIRPRTRDCIGDNRTKCPMIRGTGRKHTVRHRTGCQPHLVQMRADDFTVPPGSQRVPLSAFHHIPAERDLALPVIAASLGATRVAHISDTITLSAPDACQMFSPL